MLYLKHVTISLLGIMGLVSMAFAGVPAIEVEPTVKTSPSVVESVPGGVRIAPGVRTAPGSTQAIKNNGVNFNTTGLQDNYRAGGAAPGINQVVSDNTKVTDAQKADFARQATALRTAVQSDIDHAKNVGYMNLANGVEAMLQAVSLHGLQGLSNAEFAQALHGFVDAAAGGNAWLDAKTFAEVYPALSGEARTNLVGFYAYDGRGDFGQHVVGWANKLGVEPEVFAAGSECPLETGTGTRLVNDFVTGGCGGVGCANVALRN